jgi:hypothetical protein
MRRRIISKVTQSSTTLFVRCITLEPFSAPLVVATAAACDDDVDLAGILSVTSGSSSSNQVTDFSTL